jgi:hypothetical protein
MPIVPTSLPASPQIAQLPGVRTPSASPAAFGAGLASGISSLGDSIGQASNTIETARQRLQTRRDAEDADRALTAYTAEAYSIQDGRIDPTTGQATPGITSRKYAAATGAAKDWAETERKWLDAPDSPYAALSPAARKIFEQHRAPLYQRLTDRMITHEINQTEAQRAVDREAAFAIHDKSLTNAVGSPEFETNLPEAAARAADLALKGQVYINPDGTRTFAPSTKPLWEAAATEYTEKARLTAAAVLASRAADASLDPAGQTLAAANLEAAAAQAALLTPAAAAKAQDAITRARSARETRAHVATADAEHATRQAREAVSQELDKRFSQSSKTNFTDIDDAISEIYTINEQAGPHANYALADRHAATLRQMAARRAEANQKAADEQTAAQVQVRLDSGFYLDAQDNLVYMSPQERAIQADVSYAHGQISEGEWKAIKANASKDQDKRLGQFHEDATRLLLPDLAQSLKIPKLWELDKTTDRVMITPDKQNPLKFGPQRDSGIDRTHTGPNGKPVKENIYLGQITEALNIFRERMEIDPRYTPAAAIADLKEFIRPHTEEYAKATATEALSKQAWMNNTIRQTITKKTIKLTTPGK